MLNICALKHVSLVATFVPMILRTRLTYFIKIMSRIVLGLQAMETKFLTEGMLIVTQAWVTLVLRLAIFVLLLTKPPHL